MTAISADWAAGRTRSRRRVLRPSFLFSAAACVERAHGRAPCRRLCRVTRLISASRCVSPRRSSVSAAADGSLTAALPQQICRNCGVPTELVEDHAAGDLICKARSPAASLARVRCFSPPPSFRHQPPRPLTASGVARAGVRAGARVSRDRGDVRVALVQRLGQGEPVGPEPRWRPVQPAAQQRRPGHQRGQGQRRAVARVRAPARATLHRSQGATGLPQRLI